MSLQRDIRALFKPLPKGKKWEPPPLPEPKRRKEELDTSGQQLILLDENKAPAWMWRGKRGTNLALVINFVEKNNWSNKRVTAPSYCHGKGDSYVACYGSTTLATRERKEIRVGSSKFYMKAKYEVVRYDDGGYITNTTGTKLKALLELARCDESCIVDKMKSCHILFLVFKKYNSKMDWGNIISMILKYDPLPITSLSYDTKVRHSERLLWNGLWNSWMPWKTPSMIMKGVEVTLTLHDEENVGEGATKK